MVLPMAEASWTDDIELVNIILKNHQPEETTSLGSSTPTFRCRYCKSVSWPCESKSTALEALNKYQDEKLKAISLHPSRTGTIPERHTFNGGENGQ